MSNRIKRVIFIVIGAVGGFFAGLTLGQILGIFVGTLFDMFDFNNANGIVISGLIGLICGAILGSVFLLLGKTVFSTRDKPLWGILFSTFIGLTIGILSTHSMSGLVDSMKFSGLGQSVGVLVGAVVGGFSGILISINVMKIQIIVTDEEKRNDHQYAQFLKNRPK